MIPVLHDPLAHLLEKLNSTSERIIIGLAGVPGSGKSTYVKTLTEAVNVQTRTGTMIALGMDGFHLTKAALSQMPDPQAAFARRGAPWTFDATGFAEHLLQLHEKAGLESVEWPGFEHEIGDPVEAAYIVAPETRLVLVEGLYLLYAEGEWANIAQNFDERWYLDTPDEISAQRLVRRHMQAWGISREAAQHRIDTNDGLNGQLVAKTREQANWLIVP